MTPHVTRMGSGPERVLAIHCSLAHAGAWTWFAEEMKGTAEVTAFDLPSHGQSADWDGDEDLHRLSTDWALSVLDTPMHLVGHSFGATVALRVATELPGYVRSLTLVEPVYFAAALADAPATVQAHQAELSSFERALERGDFESAARSFNRLWGDGVPWAGIPEATRRYMIARIGVVQAASPFLMDDNAGLLSSGALGRIDCPTMLVQGEKTLNVVEAIHAALTRRIPTAQRKLVPGAGHMVPITHPEELAEIVRANIRAFDEMVAAEEQAAAEEAERQAAAQLRVAEQRAAAEQRDAAERAAAQEAAAMTPVVQDDADHDGGQAARGQTADTESHAPEPPPKAGTPHAGAPPEPDPQTVLPVTRPDRGSMVEDVPGFAHSVMANEFGFFCVPHTLSNAPDLRSLIDGDTPERATLALLQRLVRQGGDVVTGAARLGHALPPLSDALTPGAVLHVFEPDRTAFEALSYTVALNRIDRVLVHPVTIGADPGPITLPALEDPGSDEDFESGLDLDALEATGPTAEMVRLDDLVPEDRHVGVIHLNIRRREVAGIAGAERTINRCAPTLVLKAPKRWMRRALEKHLNQFHGGLRYVSCGLVDGNIVYVALDPGGETTIDIGV